jgi:hypothetical protein
LVNKENVTPRGIRAFGCRRFGFDMLRRIARQLELIRYHSAMPPRTGWDRLMDAAMAASLLAALASVVLADQAFRTQRTILEINGLIVRDSGGELRGVMLDDPGGRVLWPGGTQPYGEFSFIVREQRSGLPLPTTIQPQQAQLNLTVFQQGTRRTMAPMDAPPEIAACIEPLLAAPGLETAQAAWISEAPPDQRSPMAWVFGVIAWWFAWFAVMCIAIYLAQLGAAVVLGHLHRTRAIRRSRNQCAVCSYDLRGLEFNERCPECGTEIS